MNKWSWRTDDDTDRAVCLRAGLLLLDASLELASNLGVTTPPQHFYLLLLFHNDP